ncbi:hypothetical protein BJ912DRAFT_924551 [Pholiota molesta]|nr:hypothetical protein BJ912DRAFT_924551 [Pholiota molesta]
MSTSLSTMVLPFESPMMRFTSARKLYGSLFPLALSLDLTFLFTAWNDKIFGFPVINATDGLNIFGCPARSPERPMPPITIPFFSQCRQSRKVDTTFGFPASNVMISKYLEFPRDCVSYELYKGSLCALLDCQS